MGFFGKKEKKEYNYLELTPQVNYKHEIRDDGLFDVLVPKFNNKTLEKLLIPSSKSPFIKANLDEFGTAAWRLIDGNNKVKSIADMLLEEFGEKIQPVYDRLTLFLTNLYKNGFIHFIEITERK
ncbi:MAG: hypothetical protein QG635_1987 [Bacteroidota bacterium]|nr:hypothetical protein [Bacteroidota bacterium]